MSDGYVDGEKMAIQMSEANESALRAELAVLEAEIARLRAVVEPMQGRQMLELYRQLRALQDEFGGEFTFGPAERPYCAALRWRFVDVSNMGNNREVVYMITEQEMERPQIVEGYLANFKAGVCRLAQRAS